MSQPLNFNLDLNSGRISVNDIENNLHIAGSIANLADDLGVRSSGILDGFISGDILGASMPVIQTNHVEVPLYFSHVPAQHNALHIIIVGAGGTGGYVVRDVARYLYSLIAKGDSRKFKITLVDGDKVEEKNLVRQNFIMRDINQHKSQVLANRYASAFGVEIEPITEMANQQTLQNLSAHFRNETRVLGLRNTQTILIGCVDNNQARREMADFVRRNRDNNVYWIDSGNERSSGQVVCGYKGISRNSYYAEEAVQMSNNGRFNMPFVTDLYPEILDPAQDHVGDDGLSCAERAQVEEQNIFVNMTAAVHIVNFTRQLISREGTPIFGVEFNIKGVNTVHYNTTKEFYQIGKFTE